MNKRQELLKEYLLACVRDNVLSFADLASPDIIHKLVSAISTDARLVIGDLLRQGGSGILRLIGAKVAGAAENIATNRRRKGA